MRTCEKCAYPLRPYQTRFCSHFCRRAERFQKVCPTCARAFSTPSYEDTRHCSRECRLAPIRRQHGTLTPRRPNGEQSRLNTWARAVKKRDGACVWCGSAENLEADHILQQSKFPELRFDISNGRTLCHSCHEKTPSYRRVAA